MFDILDISASGLVAQRTRVNTIAQNIANANTTHDAQGRRVPYQRRIVNFAAGRPDDPARPGVRVSGIAKDTAAPRRVYEPGHQDADAQGYVLYPDIKMEIEFVNAMEASRAYEANITMMDTAKAMMNSTLRLLA